MSDPREMVWDAWSPLSFKRHFGSRSTLGEGAGFKPPDWIGPEHLRRLQAYAILRAYQDNSGREFFVGDRTTIESRREYGDAALLVETAVGALLGEDQQIVTEGAEELALEEPKDPGTDADGNPIPPPDPDPEDEERRREAQAAMDLQDFLRDWAQQERLGLKLIETERLAVGLGDGVYSLGWSSEKKRPRLRVWDPTFYFPVLTDTNEDDYPKRVHIAWEVDDPDLAGRSQIKIRRITWELGDIEPAEREGTLRRLLGSGDQLFRGDRMGSNGKIQRDYPWNDEPSTQTCYYSDATWTVDAGNRSVDDLTESEAVYEVDDDGVELRRRDLFVDFVPVVHLPNTVSLLNHFGRSLLSTVLQILDDVSSADTDLSAASATTGHPILALQGATVRRDKNGNSTLTYRPGEILETGEGKMDVLDTSKALAALMGYIEFLLSRLSTNSRIAEALLGRIKPSEVPSGIALALGFGPTNALIRSMRLVRTEKYPLMLKFVHRMYQAAEVAGEDVGEIPPEWIHTEVVMGSFLPQDQAAAVEQVTKLLSSTPPAISTETAIVMLMEVGMPIQSVLEEVRRIQERDFKGAAELFEAIGETGPVYDYLGLEQPPEPEEPEPVIVDPTGQPIPDVPPVPPVPGPQDPAAPPVAQ